MSLEADPSFARPDGDTREYSFDESRLDLSRDLPLLPLDGDVLFPGAAQALGVTSEASIALLESLRTAGQPVIAVFPRGEPAAGTERSLHPVGVVARVIRTMGHASGNYGVALLGLRRVALDGLVAEAPFPVARVHPLDAPAPAPGEHASLVEELRGEARGVLALMPELPRQAEELVEGLGDAGQLADLVAGRLAGSLAQKVELLSTADVAERVRKVAAMLQSLRGELEERARAAATLREPWPFEPDGVERIEGMLAGGSLTAEEAEDLRHFVEKGYVVWRNAIEPELVDGLLADIRSVPRHPGRFLLTDHKRGLYYKFSGPELDEYESLFDLYVNFESSRRLCFHPRILRFLELLFAARPIAFQQLLFQRSNQHQLHQDTAYVKVEDPLLLAATWIALEDVVPGRGELVYYEGSHRLPHFRFHDGSKRFNAEYDDPDAYVRHVTEQCAEHGCPRRAFLAKKGDVFLWAADLVHGSAPRTRPEEETRLSCVTHYCPETSKPFWFRDLRGNQGLEPYGDRAFMASSYYSLPKEPGIVRPSFKLPEVPGH